MTINHSKLWGIMFDSPSDDTIQKRLEQCSDTDIKEIGAALIDIRTEFVDSLVTSSRGDNASEDILDDLAGMLVRSGKDRFEEYERGERALPPRVEWDKAELASVVPCVADVVSRRLGMSLLDLYEMQID